MRWVPVGEVGEVRMGKQLSPNSRSAGEQYPYLRVANVLDGHIDYSDVKTMGFSSAERKTYGLVPGDVLLNEGQSLELVGRSAIYDGGSGEYCFQNTLVRFRPGPMVLPKYAQAVFKRWLATGVFAGIAKKTTSIAHLGGDRFAQLLFPLISLERQRRIVEVLDAVTESERAVGAAIAKLGPLRGAFLADLAGHERTQLSAVIVWGPQNGLYKSAESYGETGLPIVRISSFAGGPSDLTRGLLRVTASAAEVRRYGVAAGDLLINRVNTPALVGKSTVVSRLQEPTLFESNIMRCSLDREKVDPRFVEAWMSTSVVKEYFASRTKPAVSQASINSTDVLACPFPSVGIPEQRKFLSQLDAIDVRVAYETAELTKLRVLKQGLTGDLLSGKVRVDTSA
ncbi:restriction endonuclease subunit S [Streptomyces sp. SCA3-4]|uniref:restriction endonuclease subunit S n=1 Tax=Streptomyces sichuanensis TaxID=2871810 RepID=UPI001CE354D3|nr:restriction endonuclease subunit S [Streptomyces sichuanensis]MCA6094306.1 restriction endonuclease subunit S [Streptomyces sichuanensis]